MRSGILVASLIAFAFGVFGQSDRGTITGTVSDPAGAVVANAPILAGMPTQSGIMRSIKRYSYS